MRVKDLRAAVLTNLYELYKKRGGSAWVVSGLDEELGVGHGDSAMVIRDLAERGLVERGQSGGARLTARGIEAIEEPGTEEHQLVATVQHVQHVNVHGGNVQVGDHNRQTITYQTMLGRLADEIEKSPGIPEAEKRRWTATLKEIAVHPMTQTILAAAAALGAATLGK
jgi:hypothetical protein